MKKVKLGTKPLYRVFLRIMKTTHLYLCKGPLLQSGSLWNQRSPGHGSSQWTCCWRIREEREKKKLEINISQMASMQRVDKKVYVKVIQVATHLAVVCSMINDKAWTCVIEGTITFIKWEHNSEGLCMCFTTHCFSRILAWLDNSSKAHIYRR